MEAHCPLGDGRPREMPSPHRGRALTGHSPGLQFHSWSLKKISIEIIQRKNSTPENGKITKENVELVIEINNVFLNPTLVSRLNKGQGASNNPAKARE